jgi:hypothetical protein
MTECKQLSFGFSRCKGRKVEADFEGGDITQEGGLLLLREVDRQLGLLDEAAKILPDHRVAGRVVHRQRDLIKQRVFAIAQGWEDLNDHERLRHDPLLQSATEKMETLASAPTLCRMEARANRAAAAGLNKLLLKKFIESFEEPPEEVMLDFDATDDVVHGHQEGRFFHGYYDRYCFLPLYVFCGSQPLLAWLRPANIDASRGAWLALRWLVEELREVWPQVAITWRADSGFCRWRMLRWSERHRVDYIVGLARNKRLARLSEGLAQKAAQRFESTGEKSREFDWIEYGARSWDRERRVIAKAEYTEKGINPRYVVTSLPGEPRQLYDELYCARGDMENRIKEQQLGLFADRTSCHRWWPNQLRLLFSTLAYVLIDTLRRKALKGTELARAQVTRIRLELLKIGAVVLKNTRRIRVHLSSGWPRREIFAAAHAALICDSS